ncbi:MAG: hypothetical protein V3V09_01680 [Arenicellales bacterium]
MLNTFIKFSLAFMLAVLLSACGNGEPKTQTQAAQTTEAQTAQAQAPETTEASTETATENVAVIGPDLNGATWTGYLKSERDGIVYLTAVVTQAGNQVTITTSVDGIAHELIGTISPAGKVDAVDQFDKEDWTSVYGNVSKNSINLGDYIANDKGRIVDQNILILKR